MPKSVEDILANAENLSKRIKEYEPTKKDEKNVKVFKALQEAAMQRSLVEKNLVKQIIKARANGYSWSLIGSFLGTTGEAARQRYGNN